MLLNSFFINITELDRLCLAVGAEAQAATFGAEANTGTNSICSAFGSVSDVLSDYWQLLLIAANTLSDYRDLVNKDMQLVMSAGNVMMGMDRIMAASIQAMQEKMG